MLFCKRWECPLRTGWLKAMHTGVWELGKQIPRRACAFWTLAAKIILRHCHWLHRYFWARLCCGVVHLRMRIVFCAQLHCRLHCNLSFMGKTVTAVRGWRTVASVVIFRVCLRLNLNHSSDTWTCKTAEYIQPPVFPTIKVHAQDSRKNQQNHSKVEYHHNCCLEINHRRSDVVN